MRKNTSITSVTEINKDTIDTKNNQFKILDDCKSEFIKAMKIGYYKEFYKQGLITAEQLEQLIAVQNNKTVNSAA